MGLSGMKFEIVLQNMKLKKAEFWLRFFIRINPDFDLLGLLAFPLCLL